MVLGVNEHKSVPVHKSVCLLQAQTFQDSLHMHNPDQDNTLKINELFAHNLMKENVNSPQVRFLTAG